MNKKGFTLIEMLVVVLIVCVCVCIGIILGFRKNLYLHVKIYKIHTNIKTHKKASPNTSIRCFFNIIFKVF